MSKYQGYVGSRVKSSKRCPVFWSWCLVVWCIHHIHSLLWALSGLKFISNALPTPLLSFFTNKITQNMPSYLLIIRIIRTRTKAGFWFCWILIINRILCCLMAADQRPHPTIFFWAVMLILAADQGKSRQFHQIVLSYFCSTGLRSLHLNCPKTLPYEHFLVYCI